MWAEALSPPGQSVVVQTDHIDPITPRARLIEMLEGLQGAQYVSVSEGDQHLGGAVGDGEPVHVPGRGPRPAAVIGAYQHIADGDRPLIGDRIRVVSQPGRSLR